MNCWPARIGTRVTGSLLLYLLVCGGGGLSRADEIEGQVRILPVADEKPVAASV